MSRSALWVVIITVLAFAGWAQLVLVYAFPNNARLEGVCFWIFVATTLTLLFTLGLGIAGSIQSRFTWISIPFSLAFAIAFPVDLVFMSPPFRGIPGISEALAETLYFWFFYAGNSVAAIGLVWMIWNQRNKVKSQSAATHSPDDQSSPASFMGNSAEEPER